jgi:putative ABC transport system permease protein
MTARTIEEYAGNSTRRRRVLAYQVLFFALVAFLVSVGAVFATAHFAIARRHAEIGIRLALGASRRDILRLTLGEFLPWIACGVISGVVFTYCVVRGMSAWVTGVMAIEAYCYSEGALIIGLAAIAASVLPVMRIDTGMVSSILRE